MLFAGQSDLFRRAFGVPILNRYGGRELGAMACQYEDLGPLWVLRPWLFLEVVNESGKPASPGQTGRLIWTSTLCRGTPFLRYDIGDLGVFDELHADESGIAALRELDARLAGLLQLPDGRKVSALFWNHAFKGFPEVRQFQVILCKDGSVQFLLVGEGFSPAREAELTAMLRGFLRAIPFRFSWVQAIPRTARGKLVQVVREGPQP
jgi:phenylacetate-CoA ligase